MALNPDYIPLTSLWELHSDKDTGELLRSGYALFFRDTERTIGKPVFQITGSPPNYTYIEYGALDLDGAWRIDLNDQGAFDSIPYGYVLDVDGNTDLYFIQFYSADGVFQFSREGWPQFIADSIAPTQSVEINYVPNGQFRLHLDLPVSSNYEAGQVRSPITYCAFGGWTFDRPIGSTARDFVTFKRFDAYTSNPDKSPRYEIEIECESASPGDGYKDLRLKFDDVNKFADPVNEFTFAISGKVALGGAINVDLILIKNFGTGGDTATETTLTTFALTSTYQIFYHAFCFGTNVGKSIGVLNDDYIQLALRFPVDNIYDVVFTDAILTPGNVSSPIFDDTTTRQFIYRSIFSNVCPNPDGSDLYLPLTLSPDGLIPDTSVIGSISAKATYIIGKGELDCDGAKYEGEGYSTDGIPYSRLRSKIIHSIPRTTPAVSIPLFGTGKDFLTADVLSVGNLKISTNTKGSTAAPSDGSTPTGFVFKTNHIGQVDVDAKGYFSFYDVAAVSPEGKLFIIADKVGSVDPGFSDGGGFGATYVFNNNGDNARFCFTLDITAVIASSYFAFDAGDGAGSQKTYVVWYKVNGVGTAPSSPGSTFIEIDLDTGLDVDDIAKITADSISGSQVSQITCAAASTITAGSFFVLDTLTQSYYVWYKKDGAGTDPAPSGKIGIKVDITGTDTKAQVTSKTATAINIKYFAAPDLRGLLLRSSQGDAENIVDMDYAHRYANNSVLAGNQIGTLQYSSNISHVHPFYSLDATSPDRAIFTTAAINGGASWIEDGPTPIHTPIASQGETESRPQNIYVNYVIKY
jgi:hypothetical protein